MFGFKHAFRGLLLMLKSERNFKIQLVLFLCVIIFGFLFQITKSEWIIILIVSGIVLTLEIVNSAIEKIGDFISPEYHDSIKNIKDISAGAVLLAALFASVIGGIIFIPYILQ